MKILIAGASGFVGSHLTRILSNEHELLFLSHSQNKDPSIIHWSAPDYNFDSSLIEGIDAVINLSGASIANGRWTEKRKKVIRDSRVNTTRSLCNALSHLAKPPKVYIGASAIGYYPSSGDTELNEKSSPTSSFLSKTCQEWEEASAALESTSIRRVLLRIGVVLHPAGGALKKMLTPFKLGVGGILGSGNQYMSWIHMDDLLSMFLEALFDNQWMGVYNATAPEPVTNYTFTKSLGKAISRPTIFPLPAFIAKIAFGEMAKALLLSSQRVIPEKATQQGFNFKYSNIDACFKSLF